MRMVTISLCLIVKNEEEVLGRCLASAVSLADEIVIVDTGSSDRTKKIAENYTNRIYDYPWQDDFASARNFSFSKAAMDYCMWLDADDVIEESDIEKILEWKKHTDGNVDVVMMPYAAEEDEQGRPVFSYYRERMLRKESGFHWEGFVHEAIAVRGKVDYLEAVVRHRKTRPGDADRNLRIYEKMKRKGISFGARETYYYARELYYHRRYTQARQYFESFLGMTGGIPEDLAEGCRLAAYCCYALNQEKDALDFLYLGLRFGVLLGELCCDIGKHFYDRGSWGHAAFWYEAARNAPKEKESCGFVRQECYGYLPCVQLSVCYDRMGDFRKAKLRHQEAGKWKPYGKEYLRNKNFFEQTADKINF